MQYVKQLLDLGGAVAASVMLAGNTALAASMQLLDALMQETTGQRFNTQGIEDFCKEWLAVSLKILLKIHRLLLLPFRLIPS